MKKRCEFALWGSPFRLSNLKCFESIFVGGVRIILFVVKKGFQFFYQFWDKENNKFATRS